MLTQPSAISVGRDCLRATARTAALCTVSALAISACTLSPTALTDTEVSAIATSSLARVTANQKPIGPSVTLHQAMARALKYNLDHRVEMMQSALRQQELELAHYSLLPAALANSNYNGRNNDSATGSRHLLTDAVTPPTTTQYERRSSIADITLSWNILDFGLSLVRARQSADKVLIAEEARRKVVHRIIEDVRTAYWRAASSDRMISKLRRLERRTRTAQMNARALARGQDTSPITALTYERELIEIRRTLQQLQHDLSVAKAQLSALMNLAPGTDFALATQASRKSAAFAHIDERALVQTALTQRAEVREVIYQQRINEQEARAALLELLPGIQLYAGANHDTNKYLLNKEWVTWGAKATWNVMRVFQYPAKRAVVESQDALLNARALALTMAIMTQVHVSRIRYANAHRELATAGEYLNVQTRLLGQMRAEARADRISEQTLIREELNTLVAEVKHDLAFVNVQNALGGILAAAGIDLHAGVVEPDMDVDQLAQQLRAISLEKGVHGAPFATASYRR